MDWVLSLVLGAAGAAILLGCRALFRFLRRGSLERQQETIPRNLARQQEIFARPVVVSANTQIRLIRLSAAIFLFSAISNLVPPQSPFASIDWLGTNIDLDWKTCALIALAMFSFFQLADLYAFVAKFANFENWQDKQRHRMRRVAALLDAKESAESDKSTPTQHVEPAYPVQQTYEKWRFAPADGKTDHEPQWQFGHVFSWIESRGFGFIDEDKPDEGEAERFWYHAGYFVGDDDPVIGQKVAFFPFVPSTQQTNRSAAVIVTEGAVVNGTFSNFVPGKNYGFATIVDDRGNKARIIILEAESNLRSIKPQSDLKLIIQLDDERGPASRLY